MPQLLKQKSLVIGVASSALFDLAQSDEIFREQGVEAYEQYQDNHIDEPFKQGVAFPFISKLLEFNKLFSNPHEEGVEVIVMSRNSPKTGLRVMNSIEHYGLGITRAIFRSGMSTFDFINVFNMSLVLSGNEKDVNEAVEKGLPAGYVLDFDGYVDTTSNELRVAFDFDGVLAGDSSERFYQQAKAKDPQTALEQYSKYESGHADQPIEGGPLKALLEGINTLQDASRASGMADKPELRVSLVTARDAPAHKRAIKTLEQWGLSVDDAFFLGGLDKAPVLNELKPHIFFDDQIVNLDSSELHIPAVHIPFGVRNATNSKEDANA
ncbi:5'-nucleotidase [Bifidobacterium leontopitheci]|uniref:5'-nucleotidase n=1 Tax=Bifidobacterium leontopitheci TaxID=2650774 RepID=A0A6I1GH61_9BIFI|nr:5'-nucleotidase [Bifidobacterium leontopitheci]KAB7790042.1 5'-nucleotidase [Bifidobacterium leontopitheci]